ncbi:MAG: hypothetical protein PHV60_07020 [bacterium]|nr:hypothetical protein [bacterium]
MVKMNCWEFKKCGREPGGTKETDLGVCPATVETRTDKINTGKNGGRACWVIAGTYCQGEIQGTFASKIRDCIKCEFFLLVAKEEGVDFKALKDVTNLLKKE